MSQQVINVGSAANDGTGDQLRTAMQKAVSNFAELYANSTLSIQNTIGTTKGDLIVFSGSATAVRIGTGSDGQVLTADSAQTLGVKWATPSSGGVTSIGGATGVITLQDGITVLGNRLAIDLPKMFATQSALGPAAGTFTNIEITSYIESPNSDLFLVASSGHSTYVISSSGTVFIEGGGHGGAVLNFWNSSSLGSVTGGARIGAIGGEMWVLDSSGNITQISPHAKNAPIDLYEQGAGIDEMHATINQYLGQITWFSQTRRHIIDELDFAGRLGSPEESSAAWTEVIVRKAENKIRCTIVELFSDYQSRTGSNIWYGDSDEERAAFAALNPVQRWDFIQNQHAETQQDNIDNWLDRKTKSVAEGKPFLEIQPAEYIKQPAPEFLSLQPQ